MDRDYKLLNVFLKKYGKRGKETISNFVISMDCTNFVELQKFIIDALEGIPIWGPYNIFEIKCDHTNIVITFDLNRNDGCVEITDFQIDGIIPQNIQWIIFLLNQYAAINHEDFFNVLDALIKSGSCTCHVVLGLKKNHIMKRTLKKMKLDPIKIRILLFFEIDEMRELLQKIYPENWASDFFDKNKLLLFVMDKDFGFVSGKNIAIFGVKKLKMNVDTLTEFFNKKSDSLREKTKFLSRMSFVDDITKITPPEFFYIEEYSDENSYKFFYTIFANYGILFILIYFSTHINYEDCSTWSLVIQGDFFIESNITYDHERKNIIIKFDKTRYILRDPLNISHDLFEIYKWIYGEYNLERIYSSKKIISMSIKNYSDLIIKIKTIYTDILSHWEIYLSEKIDKFINFRQNFTDYLFHHNQEVTRFYSTLSSDMTDTSFKIFGYLLVFLLGWQEKASETQFASYYIILGLFFLFVYLLFGSMRLKEMKEAYDDFDANHQKHLDYYKNFIGDLKFNKLVGNRKMGKEKFNKKYTFYYGILCVILIIIGILFGYFLLVDFIGLSIPYFISITVITGFFTYLRVHKIQKP